MNNSPRLQTARLLLRPLVENDFEDFYQTFILDERVMRFWHAYQQPMTDEERRTRARTDFFDEMAAGMQESGYIVWALTPRDISLGVLGTLIGWCGILRSGIPNRDIGPQITYMLSSAYHGRSLIPEAAEAVMADAFRRYKLDCIHAVMDTPNKASRRVAEKLGLNYRGQISAYGSDDMVYYTMDRPIWLRG